MPPAGLVPAAALPTSPSASASPQVYELRGANSAIAAFETVLGGRELLTAELITSPDLTPAIQRVLTLIYDPRFDREPLGHLCAKAGVSPGEFFASFRDATLAKANVQAMRQIAEALPKLTADLLVQSVGHDERCEDCQGEKTIRVTVADKQGRKRQVDQPCSACRGKGTVWVKGNLEVQKIALELAGLLRKGGGGVSITNQQLNVQKSAAVDAGGADGLAQLQQAVSGILFGRDLPRSSPAPLDAEVVAEDAAPSAEATSL